MCTGWAAGIQLQLQFGGRVVQFGHQFHACYRLQLAEPQNEQNQLVVGGEGNGMESWESIGW